MFMVNKNVCLRYIKDDDIEDYIRWVTTETEWCHWDAPWEEYNTEEFIQWQRNALKKSPKIYNKLEIEIADDNNISIRRHIGWVSSYRIERNNERIAVGIDIPAVHFRGKGYGENALTLFMAYLFNKRQIDTLYTQTWSGNTAMIYLAEKIGFNIIECIKDLRKVRGKYYDSLTFSISKSDFFSKYSDICTIDLS